MSDPILRSPAATIVVDVVNTKAVIRWTPVTGSEGWGHMLHGLYSRAQDTSAGAGAHHRASTHDLASVFFIRMWSSAVFTGVNFEGSCCACSVSFRRTFNGGGGGIQPKLSMVLDILFYNYRTDSIQSASPRAVKYHDTDHHR